MQLTQSAHEEAAPPKLAALAAPTPHAVLAQLEYVYLLRVVSAVGVRPKANIPRVLLPAADPLYAATLAEPTPHAVEEQVAYVYLFLTELAPPAYPSANIPLVPFPVDEP